MMNEYVSMRNTSSGNGHATPQFCNIWVKITIPALRFRRRWYQGKNTSKHFLYTYFNSFNNIVVLGMSGAENFIVIQMALNPSEILLGQQGH